MVFELGFDFLAYSFDIKSPCRALADVTHLVGVSHRNVAGLIHGQGTYPGFRFYPKVGHVWEAIY